jgi:eukaryotic-like serine/threonine-protein kinase
MNLARSSQRRLAMENASQTPASENVAVGPDLTGQTVGDYCVLRKLGQGGMGQVYLAEQQFPRRKVALKILRADLAADKRARERFKQEANTVAQLTHPNIVQVYTAGESQGLHYMALEYVEGRNLREYLTRKGTPEVLLAISVMRQVASALQRASEAGIIHRDIKPENILLTRKGEVKVTDFGLVRVLQGDRPPVNLTQSGVTMGTPLYMSPEQVEGKPVDIRTDIYSLGVTSYHMMAGEPPFRGSSAFEVALQHVRAEAAPLASIRPDLPAGLCAVIHKMMAKDPTQRYQTCREVLRDLQVVRDGLSGVTGFLPLTTGVIERPGSGGQPATMPPKPVSTQMAIPRSRRRLVMFVLSLLFAGALGLGVGVWRQRTARVYIGEKLPGDPQRASDVMPLSKREQVRRAYVEVLLDPANGYKDAVTGVQFCRDLALDYLEQNRFDDAQKLFLRLEAIQPNEKDDEETRLYKTYYHTLGVLGRAIVLGLLDRPNESNDLFRKLPTKHSFVELRKTNRRLGKWVAEAIHHNIVNGIKRESIPNPFRSYADLPKGPRSPSPRSSARGSGKRS